MIVKVAKKNDIDNVARLIAQFRLEHKLIKGIRSSLDIESAKKEFREFIDANFPIYMVINESEEVLGYIVCRIQDNVVWVEQIYVVKHARRKGIATLLFKKAEEVAHSFGCETLYNWVLPNNDKIIKFLSKNGYGVLNMIEIRKAYKNEQFEQEIQVGRFHYKY